MKKTKPRCARGCHESHCGTASNTLPLCHSRDGNAQQCNLQHRNRSPSERTREEKRWEQANEGEREGERERARGREGNRVKEKSKDVNRKRKLERESERV